jgi:hypothetical protein
VTRLLDRALLGRLCGAPRPVKGAMKATVLGVVSVPSPPQLDELVSDSGKALSIVRCSLQLYGYAFLR